MKLYPVIYLLSSNTSQVSKNSTRDIPDVASNLLKRIKEQLDEFSIGDFKIRVSEHIQDEDKTFKDGKIEVLHLDANYFELYFQVEETKEGIRIILAPGESSEAFDIVENENIASVRNKILKEIIKRLHKITNSELTITLSNLHGTPEPTGHYLNLLSDSHYSIIGRNLISPRLSAILGDTPVYQLEDNGQDNIVISITEHPFSFNSFNVEGELIYPAYKAALTRLTVGSK